MAVKNVRTVVFLSLILNQTSISCCLRIGHRGACGYEPENTLRSFKKALELSVDMIELDVYCCASGEVVVFHDKTLNRTTNGTGPVEEKTLDELKQLDAGSGERIPTLSEVLDCVTRRAAINIEHLLISPLLQKTAVQQQLAYQRTLLHRNTLTTRTNATSGYSSSPSTNPMR